MNSRKSFHREVKMMIAEGFTCQRYGFNVGADKFSLLTIENGKTSIMRLSEWTLISQNQKSHSDRLLAFWGLRIIYIKIQRNNDAGCKESYFPYLPSLYGKYGRVIKTQVFRCIYVGFIISLVLFVGLYVEFIPTVFYPYYTVIDLTYQKFFEPYAIHLGYIGIFILKYLNIFIWSLVAFSIFRFSMSGCRTKCDSANSPESKE